MVCISAREAGVETCTVQPSSNGARPKTPATVVSGAFPPRPAASPFSPPVEDQLHHLAHETRKSVKNRPNTATGTPAHRRVKREHSPDVRRGSAYNQAQKSGVITPKVTDVMLITGPKERVEKPRNTKVDASSLAGATRHHLWEQGNIDAASDVPYVWCWRPHRASLSCGTPYAAGPCLTIACAVIV